MKKLTALFIFSTFSFISIGTSANHQVAEDPSGNQMECRIPTPAGCKYGGW